MPKLNFDEIKDFLKHKQKLILLIAFVLAIGFLLLSNYGVFKRIRFEVENANIKSDIQLELQRKDSLENRIEELKTDRSEIERLAREKYGMIKPGEEIYFHKEKKDD